MYNYNTFSSNAKRITFSSPSTPHKNLLITWREYSALIIINNFVILKKASFELKGSWLHRPSKRRVTHVFKHIHIHPWTYVNIHPLPPISVHIHHIHTLPTKIKSYQHPFRQFFSLSTSTYCSLRVTLLIFQGTWKITSRITFYSLWVSYT